MSSPFLYCGATMSEIVLDGVIHRRASDQAHRLGVHTSAIIRWIKRKGLPAKRTPGRWLIADSDLDEFLRRLADERQGKSAPLARTTRQRQRAAERARRELDKMGI